MPTSPAGSLFASDYSLSAPPSPESLSSRTSPRATPSPRPSPSPQPRASPLRESFVAEHGSFSSFPFDQDGGSGRQETAKAVQKPMQIKFPPVDPANLSVSTLPTPPVSPSGVSPVGSLVSPTTIRSNPMDSYTPLPPKILRKKSSQIKIDPLDEPFTPARRSSSVAGYKDYDACMEGGLGHETKSATYKLGTEKAYHHLNRANDCFAQALKFRPSDPRAMLGRSKLLIALATNYQTPRVSILSLREAVSLLRDLAAIAPNSISVRETLAQACALLSQTLLETEDAADEEQKIWEGPIGQLARESLAVMEDVAGDKMDRMRDMSKEEATEQSPGMAETFIALSTAALAVATLATDLYTVDLHVELSEQALDQASNMATIAAAARVKGSTSSANLITRVQLASGKSSLERLRHTFVLGRDLDEDDFRSLLADMSILATECRERVVKLKGSKAAAASTLAHEAVKQFGDAQLMYASLLRLVWRKRRPRRKAGAAPATPTGAAGTGSRGSISVNSPSRSSGPRKLSERSETAEPAIMEEDEDEGSGVTTQSPEFIFETAQPGRLPSIPLAPIASSTGSAFGLAGPVADLRGEVDRRRSSGGSSSGSSSSGPSRSRQNSRKDSGLDSIPDDQPVTSFSPTVSRFGGGSFAIPKTGRRGSWLPTSGDALVNGRQRRMSSMSAPLQGPDGISAWTRKASVISLAADETAQGLVTSSQLAQEAWNLLERSLKQYKLCLPLLSGSDLPSAHLARFKCETLAAISYVSLFMASLSGRVVAAAEKRTSLLVTAEVYATWGAREVGWSFLIEGTREAQLADRRTNSWRADEAGKRAVMLLVRVWWHRAVTAEGADVDTKTAAKDAVERVVRRMKDREGVRDGDVVRFKAWLARLEGSEMDAAEALFWRSASRILRGGSGFVMS